MVRGAALIVGLAWLAPSGASAQETTASPEARAHFEAGTQAFDVGEYERAATEFRAAYELTRHPDLLFNIYSALERAGRIGEAADALEGYLRDGDPDEERRTALSARLARMRARLAEERAARAEAELAASREREPGSPAEPAAPAEPPAPSGGVHPAGVAVLIGGGVLLASFVVFASLAAAENGSLASSCSPACSDSEVSTLQAFTLVADISWISGAVVAATGLVLLFVLPPEGGAGGQASLTPWIAPDGAGLVAAGRW